MIYIRREGEQVKNGLNFYPLTDKGSIGVILRIGKHAYHFRYSKITKKTTFIHLIDGLEYTV